jgi:hypothetical protein
MAVSKTSIEKLKKASSKKAASQKKKKSPSKKESSKKSSKKNARERREAVVLQATPHDVHTRGKHGKRHVFPATRIRDVYHDAIGESYRMTSGAVAQIQAYAAGYAHRHTKLAQQHCLNDGRIQVSAADFAAVFPGLKKEARHQYFSVSGVKKFAKKVTTKDMRISTAGAELLVSGIQSHLRFLFTNAAISMRKLKTLNTAIWRGVILSQQQGDPSLGHKALVQGHYEVPSSTPGKVSKKKKASSKKAKSHSVHHVKPDPDAAFADLPALEKEKSPKAKKASVLKKKKKTPVAAAEGSSKRRKTRSHKN